MKKLRIKPVLLLLLMLTVLSSCTKLEDYEETETSLKDFPGTKTMEMPLTWETSTTGGTWNTTFSQEPTSYNPFANLDDSHGVITGTIFESLFDYDPVTSEWKGFLIESWKVNVLESSGEMELICTLRDNIYWSDGVQMTADDVVYSFTELEGNPDLNPRNYQGQLITMDDGSEVQIKAETVDKLTWKYIFPRQMSTPELMVNTNDIVPKHIWKPVVDQGLDAVRDFWGITTPPEELISNGPFLLETYKQGERLIYKRNPRYWLKDDEGNSLPYMETIISTFIPDTNPTASLLKFQQGEVESYGLRGQDMATLLPESEEKGFTIWNGGISTSYPFLTFNQNPALGDEEKNKLFMDKRFRYAVSSLIDRQTIIDQTINGFAQPCYYMFGDNNKYYNPEYKNPYSFNPEKAAELLKEIGLKDSNGDGILEYESGRDVTFSLMVYHKDTIVHDYLNIILSDMEKAGIRGTLEVVDFNLWVQKLLNTYDWDCTLYVSSFPTFPEQWFNVWQSRGNMHFWHPKQESPATEWEKRLDELNALLKYTWKEEEVRPLYDEFQKILIDQLPMIPLYNKYTFMAVYDKWGNINWDNKHSLGDYSRRLYLKPEYRE